VTSALRTEEKLIAIHSDIRRHIGELEISADKNKNDVTSMYEAVRQQIWEREQSIKRNIADNLGRE